MLLINEDVLIKDLAQIIACIVRYEDNIVMDKSEPDGQLESFFSVQEFLVLDGFHS